jgi:hypothetical protein
MILDFKEFDNIYQNTVHEIFRFWTKAASSTSKDI